MASRPEKVQLQTASDVQWSDGTNFQGSLLLVLVLPSGYTKAHLKGQDIHQFRVPTRVKVPIVDGVMSSDVRLWKNEDLEPPETVWHGFWYDATDTNIATDSPSLTAINTDPTTITPPTLTVPTAAVAGPTEGSLGFTASGGGALGDAKLFSAGTLTRETASGSGSSVTVANTPIAVLQVILHGQVLAPTTDYTISGKTITMVNVTVSANEVQVLYLY